MSKALVISLISFSIIWIIIILRLVRRGKISVKYSMIWLFVALVLLIVGIFPGLMSLVADFFGFLTVSNLVIGIILTLLLLISLFLTIIITNQRSLINKLIQEVSLIKKDK